MISVIIVNYNTLELTSACISSIIEQVKSEQYEIVVVDNASTNCDPLVLKKNFPSIKLICNDTNIGFSEGNNIGIAAADGDEILLLNSDTVLLDDALRITSATLKQSQNVGIVTCRLIFPDGKVQHNCQPFPSFLKWLLEWTRFFKFLTKKFKSTFLQGRFFDYNAPGSPDWVWGTYFHFKREILLCFSNSKLPNDFFMYVEDMQWCYVFRKKGWIVKYEPGTSVVHLMGQSNGERDNRIKENLDIFLRKYYTPINRWLLRIAGW